MQELNEKQIINIYGGIGCVCQPDNHRRVKLDEAACMRLCCLERANKNYCTFQDGPKPMDIVVLESVPHKCSPCPGMPPVYPWHTEIRS
jgi:hypothetical protein